MQLTILTVALGSVSPAFAAADIEQLKTYCKPDIERLCPGVGFAGGALKKCLKQNQNEMSVGCAKALKALKDG